MQHLARYIFFYFDISIIKTTLWLKRFTNISQLSLDKKLVNLSTAFNLTLAEAMALDGDIYE